MHCVSTVRRYNPINYTLEVLVLHNSIGVCAFYITLLHLRRKHCTF